MLNNILTSIDNLKARASIHMAVAEGRQVQRHEILSGDQGMMVPAGSIVALDVNATSSRRLTAWGQLQKEARLGAGTIIFVDGIRPSKINPASAVALPVDFKRLSAFEGPAAAKEKGAFYLYSVQYTDGGLRLINGAITVYSSYTGYVAGGASHHTM